MDVSPVTSSNKSNRNSWNEEGVTAWKWMATVAVRKRSQPFLSLEIRRDNSTTRGISFKKFPTFRYTPY